MPATGWIQARASAFLAAEAAAFPWICLHTGHPGAAGTANLAVETDRLQAVWGAVTLAVDSRSVQIAWTTDLTWLAVAGSEDFTHISGRSAISGGTVGWTGELTADAVVVSNDFKIPAGAYILRQPIAYT
jgi:hypothetical protein